MFCFDSQGYTPYRVRLTQLYFPGNHVSGYTSTFLPFQVSPYVLAARSPYFKALLQNDMRETSHKEVNVREIEDEQLRQFVSYMYSGRAPALDSVEHLIQLYKVATM